MPATQVALWLGAQGPVEAPVSACATGADAVAWGAQLLRTGQADRVLVGGCEALVNRFGIAAFGAMQALSPERDDPYQASRPFDQARQGFVMAEGAAALVLEPLSSAQSRRATIHGLLQGQGVSFDAHHITAPHPDGLQAERAMRLALADAGISPDQVSFVKAHATGTPTGIQRKRKHLAGCSAVSTMGDCAKITNRTSDWRCWCPGNRAQRALPARRDLASAEELPQP